MNWETIQNPYIPVGMSEQINKNSQTQDNFSDALSMFLSMGMQQQTATTETIPNNDGSNKENN